MKKILDDTILPGLLKDIKVQVTSGNQVTININTSQQSFNSVIVKLKGKFYLMS